MSFNSSNRFNLPERFRGATYSVWVEFKNLAQKYKPINLGQGFPDYPVPTSTTSTLADVASSSDAMVHQYTRGFGHARLVNVLSKLYSMLLSRSLDPINEIMTSCGAYEALFCAVAGFIEEGDEVIIVEPFFDCYEAMVRIFGGIPRFIPLRIKNDNPTAESLSSKDWVLDPQELASKFNKKTKMFILNTPHNPTGKVFTRVELELIADLCKKHDVLCLSDEVYEWLVYKPNEHIRIATFPGMWDRTLTVGSAGKTFSVTGWKCGWIYGPNKLMENVRIAHQNNIYTFCTPLQESLAINFEAALEKLEKGTAYFQTLPSELLPKRESFMKLLIAAGFKPTIPDGGYFVMADWSKLAKKVDLSTESDTEADFKFAKWMTKNVKLLGIPPSAFYGKEHKHLASNFIRYCFFKKDETLKSAEDALALWHKL